ncbi:MAG: hypothetical protein J6M34_00120 [Clostridia bacterium]|nr:hypothetical protein [Clostridia bacterium]
MDMTKFPATLYTGAYPSGHIQGIAVDPIKGFVYCSYTQLLVKLDLQGNLVGSCEGLTGHLGCIDFNDADGRVYGSLEYKNDSIGKGIRRFLGESEEDVPTSFFIAVFDVDKITRPHMDACSDGVMKTVYLKEVVEDFNGLGESGKEHRYGCSGIDGTAFGPKFGQTEGKNYLTVAYGIYGDNDRKDNDRQVLLQYDISNWDTLLQPLSQENFHQSGPEKPDGKYFLFTGNTDWGVQNLEYDEGLKRWLLCVYRGKKPQYPNYPLFSVEAASPVCVKEKGEAELSLSPEGILHEESGVRGWNFPRGAEGIYSFGNGNYYVSYPAKTEEGYQTATLKLHTKEEIFS